MLRSGLYFLGSIFLGATASAAGTSQNTVEVKVANHQRCFTANALPDHETGTFPNRGNPNAIEPQTLEMCVTTNPIRGLTPQPIRGSMGIAINGVPFRPTTAGFYDPNGRRGHSRNGDKNWSLDIHGAPGKLGLDFNNAHVGRGGLYHYHGIAENLVKTAGSSLIGYAGDGFEMHYVGNAAVSGYQLKSGARPEGGPPGEYDGTYNEDYEHISGEGRLDECNGGFLEDRFVYFVTDTYPFVGRCLWGAISKDFAGGEHGRERSGRERRGGRRGEGRGGGRGRGDRR